MKWIALLAVTALLAAAFLACDRWRAGVHFMQSRMAAKKTVADRVEEYGALVAARLSPRFARAGLGYPPRAITLLALKSERRLDLYAHPADGPPVLVCSYPILAASGELGPKLREGDRQVPEGIYAVELLNPNSLYHLSIRLNYPNAFDRRMARADGREQLGGDIMIHGSNVSIGCLAMGDQAAEDLFVLAALVGIEKVRVIVAPVDLRMQELPALSPGSPAWLPQLYEQIKEGLRALN